MTGRVVLEPALPFAAIQAAFREGGWRGGPTTLTAPLLPGEPELAVWRKDGTVVQYEYNPVVGLRVLEVAGDALPPQLTALSPDAIRQALNSPDETTQLFGVLASTELGLREVRRQLETLMTTGTPLVRTYARRALARTT